MKKFKTCDGNTATASIAYAFSEIAAIFPITPSSPMGELADLWSSLGKKNLFGHEVKVQEMQSEAGASGTIHGCLTGGALTTTFTASQGLLLMLPNMFKIAGELLPTVFHVAARSIAAQSLSIYADHSDVMATRGTGFALLSSSSVQEAQDMAVIAHLSTLKTKVPFLHFFDGFRTSHEIKKIEEIPEKILREMLDIKFVNDFKLTGIRPETPYAKVGAENPDVYFQGRETVNKNYELTPGVVKEYMDLFYEKTGRRYEPFQYIGAKDADTVLIAMGSSTQTIEETINYLNSKGEKLGLIRVHLYRPFSIEDFVKKIPSTTKFIAVLDRTKEPGSTGEPLYLDVVDALRQDKQKGSSSLNHDNLFVIGGRYGLSSKEFTPSMVNAIITHVRNRGWHSFTVGITDDVTNLSIPINEEIISVDKNTFQCKFWGYGSDGTVSANKNSIKIIGELTDKFVQGHFAYDSKKSGGITISHLRFGDNPIKSEYEVHHPDFVALHKQSYIGRYDILEGIKEGGIFLINSSWSPEKVFENLTLDMQRIIKEKNIKVYTIDALKLAKEAGLGIKINTIMQTAFFKLTNILPEDEFISAMKKHIASQFRLKGQEIINKNYRVIDLAISEIKEVSIVDTSSSAKYKKLIPDDANDFIKKVIQPIMRLKGDEIPVSAMTINGAVPTATSRLEKRGVANMVPHWDPDYCVQCSMCSLSCPHAAIRVKQIRPEDLKDAPGTFKTLKSTTRNKSDLRYKVQTYINDCVECNLCVESCPVKGKALKMIPIEEARINNEVENEKFFDALPDNITEGTTESSIKGSQLKVPYFEFSGACAGCGETPLIRLTTQLFGDRMVIANATGCSSIYGGTFPTTPYSVNKEGLGPAWANSLFEDNAEYGYGMRLAIDENRKYLKSVLEKLLQTGTTENLKNAIEKMLSLWDETSDEAINAAKDVKKLLPEALACVYGESKEPLDYINTFKDYLVDKSVWIIGGDGWAYDIGFGGLDHVLAQGKNVNVLVLDNEEYANTGGQSSKSTPRGATAKFAIAGKTLPKKNLGAIFMTYGNVYVASVNLGANPAQLLKTLKEAESYDGPSIIIAYTPCIAHGIKMQFAMTQEKNAAKSGYWPLYRYDPRKIALGEDPLSFDSPVRSVKFEDYIGEEKRYTALRISKPDVADKLVSLAKEDIDQRINIIKGFSNQKNKE